MYKRNTKGIQTLSVWALVLLMSVFSIIPAFALAPDPFSDVPSTHWAYQAVMNMVRVGIISGYPDGTFKPDQPVSREEYAKILCGATSIPLANPNTNTFADIPNDHWAFRYVETVKDYLTGYPSSDGSKALFKGKFDATREDVAVALVKIKGFDKTVMPNPNILSDMFKDTSSISSNLKNMMAIAVEKKLMEGYPDQTIRGSQTLTRAEAAVLIDRANRISGDVKDVSYYNSAKLISLTIECSKTLGSAGESIQAKAGGAYSNGQTRDITTEVKWSSSDNSVVSISSDGKALLLKEGTAELMAVLGEKSDGQEITVISGSSGSSELIKYVRVSPETKEIKLNDTLNMKAEAVYENGKVENVSDLAEWDCTNGSIVMVSTHGKILAIKEGTVLIKAVYKNMTGYAGISVTESVYTPNISSQQAALNFITISHSYKELRKGSKFNIRVVANYSDLSKKDITGLVTWNVDNSSVAAISQNGDITAISEGVAKITAAYEGKSFTSYIIVKKR